MLSRIRQGRRSVTAILVTVLCPLLVIGQIHGEIYPEDYGAVGNGSTDDTAAWQKAENQLQASGGAIICTKKYKLNRVGLTTNDVIHGLGDKNRQCMIISKVDSAFVSKTPGRFVGDITLTDMFFVGGVNPIDIPLINGLHIERMNANDYTGCFVTLVGGERFKFHDITTGHSGGVNGFATLCSGDKSKSLFAASISADQELGLDRFSLHNIIELGSLPTSGQAYLWWGGKDDTVTNSGGDINNHTCMYSCAKGFEEMRALAFTDLGVFNADHIGASGAPEAIGIHIADMRSSHFKAYDPAWNTNWITTKLSVGCMTASTIENVITGPADNLTTFGIKSTCTRSTTASKLSAVYGSVFWTNPASPPAIDASDALTKTNLHIQ